MEIRLLKALQRFRRPFAWLILLVGIVGLLATFPFGFTSSYDDDTFWVTVAGFVLLILDGYDKVIEVEFDDDGDLTEVPEVTP